MFHVYFGIFLLISVTNIVVVQRLPLRTSILLKEFIICVVQNGCRCLLTPNFVMPCLKGYRIERVDEINGADIVILIYRGIFVGRQDLYYRFGGVVIKNIDNTTVATYCNNPRKTIERRQLDAFLNLIYLVVVSPSVTHVLAPIIMILFQKRISLIQQILPQFNYHRSVFQFHVILNLIRLGSSPQNCSTVSMLTGKCFWTN